MDSDSLRIDARGEVSRITRFVRSIVDKAGAAGVVIGVSGGIDSAVVGELCVRALGPGSVLAELLPSKHTTKRDLEDANMLVRRWGTRWQLVKIDRAVDVIEKSSLLEVKRLSNANLQARVRMTFLYLAANVNGMLVAGTGDRSEEEVGFFTKYGDGGADFLPIGHLFKTQVRALGAYLRLPQALVEKPASPGLWPGHTAAQELPVDYDRLDLVLHCLYDLKLGARETAREAGVEAKVVSKVIEMHARSSHKREVPPSLATIESRLMAAKD